MSSLSVCAIVKNEERNLPRMLASVRDVADEILIVDTGSTDRTREIALERGARVIHYDWHDDHSAARNFGWEHATCDWMLWLDGDEALVPSSIPELKSCLTRREFGAFFLQRQELIDASDESRFTEMLMIRLIRRDISSRFVGRYHTQIVPPERVFGDPPWICGHSTIKLKHWGKLVTTHQDRLKNAVRIMAKELEDDPEDFYIRVELANAYLDLRDPRGAELMHEAIRRLHPEKPRPPNASAIYVVDFLIGRPNDATQFGFTLNSLRDLTYKWFPRTAPLRWSLAQAIPKQDNLDSAIIELRELQRLIKTDTLDKIIPFDPRTGEDAEFNLAVCLTRKADLEGAEVIFKKMLNLPRRKVDAQKNLDVIVKLRAMRLYEPDA